MDPIRKSILERKRRWRVRARIFGTADRPRLSVCFSNKHIYAQCIDDRRAVTLVAVSSLSATFGGDGCRPKANVTGAKAVGEIFAAKAAAAGIKCVAFDRGARRYHGCVEAFANAAREGGLEF
jgi:large subunit ribosomal protein L18